MQYEDLKIMSFPTSGDADWLDIYYEDDEERVNFTLYLSEYDQEVDVNISFKKFNELIKIYLDKKEEVIENAYEEFAKERRKKWINYKKYA